MATKYLVYGARGAKYECDTLKEAKKVAGKNGTIRRVGGQRKRRNPSTLSAEEFHSAWQRRDWQTLIDEMAQSKANRATLNALLREAEAGDNDAAEVLGTKARLWLEGLRADEAERGMLHRHAPLRNPASTPAAVAFARDGSGYIVRVKTFGSYKAAGRWARKAIDEGAEEAGYYPVPDFLRRLRFMGHDVAVQYLSRLPQGQASKLLHAIGYSN